jgi:hypothetical protein
MNYENIKTEAVQTVHFRVFSVNKLYSSASALTKGFAICSIPSFGATTVMAVPE